MKEFNKNDNLGYLLNSTTNALNTFMQRKISDHSIDVPFEQLKLLLFISFNEGVNQQVICKELNKAKPGISRLVNGLVEKKLVEQQEDVDDRRNKKLYVTKKGLIMRDQFYPIGRKNLSGIEEQLGNEESQQLKQHLIAIKQIILNRLNSNNNE